MATTAKKTLLTTVASTGKQGDSDASMMVSTIAPDRVGDCVDPRGMDASDFLKNPALMWSHQYDKLPIGAVVSLEVQPGKGIRAAWKWLVGDEFSDRVRRAWDAGCLRGASIGFGPIRQTPNASGGFDITAWRLYEISLCPLPMNPQAVRQLKAFGLFGSDGSAPLVRSQSPQLSITGDRAVPRYRLRDDDVVCRVVDDRDVYSVDVAQVRATVQQVLGEAVTAAAGVAIQRALAAVRGRVE